jgi:hypothetical protein
MTDRKEGKIYKTQKFKHDIKAIATCYGAAGILVIPIILIMCITGKDIMDVVIFHSKELGNMAGENGAFSLWPISHFILYVCLGYFAPSLWWICLLIGIGWEIFEYIAGNLWQKYKAKSTRKVFTQITSQQYSTKWVDCRWSDILFNVAGLLVGVALARLVKSSKSEPPDTVTLPYASVTYNLL